jgi:hypothetical protein
VVRGIGAVAGGANVGAFSAAGAGPSNVLAPSRFGLVLEAAITRWRTFKPDLMVARARRQ